MSTKSHIYAFEPVTVSYNIFMNNIKSNNIQNITAINKGIYYKRDVLKMSLPMPDTLPKHVLDSNGNPGLGRYSIFDWKDNYNVISAEFDTIESLMHEYTIPVADIIKMDCEGCESLIIKSSEIIFKRCKIVVTEHNKTFDPDDELSKILIDLGFETLNTGLDRIWINKNTKK